MLARKININAILKEMQNSRILTRVDFNVPLLNGKVKDATRIKEAIPTLKTILATSPKSLVLMSHLGRPDGNANPAFSMSPVLSVLEQELGTKVK
jgi:phosphoglycerate kinase